jgi:hypothetical protein
MPSALFEALFVLAFVLPFAAIVVGVLVVTLGSSMRPAVHAEQPHANAA